jgi:hypothetical protein
LLTIILDFCTVVSWITETGNEMARKLYVGCTAFTPWELFTSETEPTFDNNPQGYAAVIGPFRTRAGAEFMRDYGKGNPHCQTVSDAEWLASHVEIVMA